MIPGATYLGRDRATPGLSDDPGALAIHGTSGFAALNVAYLRRAKRIILLGFDLTPGRCHDAHDCGAEQISAYRRWAQMFDQALPQLRRAAIHVFNGSRASAITAFPRMSIDTALQALLEVRS